MEVKLVNGNRFENETGKRVDIQMKGSNIYYRVPEDMIPFAASSKVGLGVADWVERRDRSFADKLTTAVSNVKQVLQDRRNVAESAALRRDLETASMTKAAAVGPVRFVDTGAQSDQEF